MPTVPTDHLDFFDGKRVLVTGGLGFIGSNLAHRLVSLGADVLLVDSLIPEYGGNIFNVQDIENCLRINIADMRDEHGLRYLVQGQDVIFNLAGQVSHTDSMTDPYTDLEINARSQLSLLEACRHGNPATRSSLPARGRSTAARSTCPSMSAIPCNRSTSTASTSWPASGITWSTTRSMVCAPSPCA